MKYVVKILPAGSWDETDVTDQFSADYEGRYRRRIVLTLESKERVLLDLDKTHLLTDGEGLLLDDGRIIRIVALPEALIEVTAHTSLQLLQLAWHLGNRHLPAMIEKNRIFIRKDIVIADMIKGLGGHIQFCEAPFSPESGAYAGDKKHRHSHTHDVHEKSEDLSHSGH